MQTYDDKTLGQITLTGWKIFTKYDIGTEPVFQITVIIPDLFGENPVTFHQHADEEVWYSYPKGERRNAPPVINRTLDLVVEHVIMKWMANEVDDFYADDDDEIEAV